jgi:serine protease
MLKHVLILGFLLLALSSCPSTPPNPPPPPPPAKGSISGTVGFPAGVVSADNIPELVAGDVIVKFKTGARSESRLALRGVDLLRNSSIGVGSTFLYRSKSVIDARATLGLVQNLQTRSDVEYAQPNYIDHFTKAPRDVGYPLQWHYSAINLPQAWDVVDGTQGGAPVVVAVIDTGILWAGDASAQTHPDLIGKVLPGYDMITDLRASRDGDGRDNDPFDVGDLIEANQSSYHGSHVAGTIAASTDNLKQGSSTEALGVAGVSWGAKILPVRVLGQGGGSSVDILAGVLWAAGIDVPGVPSNPNPASVINMSLGGKRPCSQSPAEQEVLNQVRAKGVIVVVAAGNNNENAADFSPASCAGVITVGATDLPGARAPYSNFGTRIDVMAPGGDVGVDTNNDQYADGVLSLAKDDAKGEFTYNFENGTSMAAPHVAGVVALMKALRPSLTPDQALNVLRDTAKPRTAVQCQGRKGGTQGVTDCGAGLIDAFAAVNAVNGLTNVTQDFNLKLSKGGLTIKPGANASVNLEIACTGGLAGLVDLTVEGRPTGVTINTNGDASCGSSVGLDIAVDASVASQTYALTFYGTSGTLERSVGFSLTVQATPPSVQGTIVLAAFVNAQGNLEEAKSNAIQLTQSSSSAAFNVGDLETGNYLVVAWKDVNGDQKLNAGDLIGLEPNLVKPSKTGLSLKLEPYSETSRLQPSVQSSDVLKVLIESRQSR